VAGGAIGPAAVPANWNGREPAFDPSLPTFPHGAEGIPCERSMDLPGEFPSGACRWFDGGALGMDTLLDAAAEKGALVMSPV